MNNKYLLGPKNNPSPCDPLRATAHSIHVLGHVECQMPHPVTHALITAAESRHQTKNIRLTRGPTRSPAHGSRPSESGPASAQSTSLGVGMEVRARENDPLSQRLHPAFIQMHISLILHPPF